MAEKIVLGTRGSDLALAQARLVAEVLRERWSDLTIETRIIRTAGDEGPKATPPVDLRAGRKGLFTAEIERALISGEIDLAVHSAKDLPSDLDAATRIAAVLPRAPAGDAMVSRNPHTLSSLPRGGTIATGSVRRRHQVAWQRPDLRLVDLRGNVPTRLRKLAGSEWDAIILAQAGLDRLGLLQANGEMLFEEWKFSVHALPREIFLPAGGQGVIALQVRAHDEKARVRAEAVDHPVTRLCLRAEREFLRLLEADCNQPIGVFAEIEGTIMTLRGQIFAPGTTEPRESIVEGPGEHADSLAARLFSTIHAT